ncbi:MAG: N-acetylneuraminate synthase [Candidatus Marinimicrobia bacterium]|nr:N-acetylneuraminate synthase [Candidatus Neomarinimicrobiota bacterium]
MNTENYQSILTKLKHNPKISQRQLSKDLGYSLGKLNYILRNLEKKKLIKNNYTKNIKKNNTNKYVITSKGRKLEESAIDYSYLALNQQNEDEKLIRKKPFLVAEIGINHNGSVLDAKKLIKLAKKHDFDAVKFQKRDLNVCIPENQKKIMRETPWGYISYLDYKKKIELSVKNYVELNVFAKKIGIDLFVSCWDINSLNLMKKLNFKYNKVASAMITNTEFLKEVAKEKKKTFISTGMCTMSDIEKAVSIFKKFNCNFVLMHSISLYPCDESLLNLNLLKTLKNKFKCEIGYSGHESSVSPSIAAFLLGADYIERHITLDRASWGTDQAASLEESGMDSLSTLLKKIPIMLGDGKKKFLKEEKKVSKKMRYWEGH